MNGSTKAVFLSYASQDADAARNVCEALRAAGIEVWFGQNELRGGDAWDASIRRQIKECALFVPLISATTDARSEGYFRLEWKLAVDRTHLMADDKAFLLPVVIDATLDANARVPDKFREVQWTHLPAGAATATFVAQVSRLLSSEGPTVPHSAAAASGNRLRSWRSRPVVLVLAGAVALAIAYLAVERTILLKRFAAVETAPAVPADSLVPGALLEKSVAVLPLVNLSGDEKDSYLGDGISGEILSALSKLLGLKVTGRASSFQFRDRDVNPAKVGRALSVHSLLTGTVQRAGDNLRISVELIDTTSGLQLWSQHFDRSFGNLFALEDDISSAVSTALAVKVGTASGQPLVHVATTNPRAHDLYLRARELSYGSDEASLNQAVALFNKAIAEDPNYAEYMGQTERARSILKQLETAARTRYADHVNIAEIHAALGERDAAFKALERAFEDRSQLLLNAWFVPEFKPLHDDPRYRTLMERTYAGLKPRTTP